MNIFVKLFFMNPQPDTLFYPIPTCSRCKKPPHKLEQKRPETCACGGKWREDNTTIMVSKPYEDNTLLDAAFYQLWYMSRGNDTMHDTLKRLLWKNLAMTNESVSDADIKNLDIHNLSPIYEFWCCSQLKNLRIGHQRNQPRYDKPPPVVLRINGVDRLLDGANRINHKIARKLGQGILILEAKEPD